MGQSTSLGRACSAFSDSPSASNCSAPFSQCGGDGWAAIAGAAASVAEKKPRRAKSCRRLKVLSATEVPNAGLDVAVQPARLFAHSQSPIRCSHVFIGACFRDRYRPPLADAEFWGKRGHEIETQDGRGTRNTKSSLFSVRPADAHHKNGSEPGRDSRGRPRSRPRAGCQFHAGPHVTRTGRFYTCAAFCSVRKTACCLKNGLELALTWIHNKRNPVINAPMATQPLRWAIWRNNQARE